MKQGFDYKEYAKWVEKLGMTEKHLQIWLKTFLLEQAQRVVKLAKERQQAVGAVDTGAMINSWYIGSQKISLKATGETSASGKASVTFDRDNSDILSIDVIGDYLQVEIGNGMEYASYVEYGHHNYAGRYILTIALDTVQKQLPARFNKEWLKFIKGRGVV